MKNRRITTVAGCVCLAIALFAGCGERSGEKEFSKALDAWNDGNLPLAQSLLEKSIRKMSGEKKSAALNQLGLVLWQLQKTEEAAEAFSASCELAEELSGANLNLGLAMLHAKRLDEAQLALSDVLGDDPKNATALAALGLIEMQKNNWRAAAQTAAESVSADPRNPAAQNALALAELHATQNSDRAIKRLKQILAAHPDYLPAAFNLAATYDHWQNNRSTAMAWYKEYLKKAGAGGSRSEAAGQALKRLASAPQKAEQVPPSAARYMNEGITLFKEKRYAAAAQAFANALKLDSGNPDARYNLSLSHYYQQNWDAAEREAKILKQQGDPRGEQMLQYISTARKR